MASAAAPDRLIEALASFGFTSYEAKAYRALVRLGMPANGYEIARAAAIPTSKVYETLGRLAAKGAVVTHASDPVTYAAVPHRDVLARLRERAEAAAASIESELDALPRAGGPEKTWTISGADNAVHRMRLLIERAERGVFGALWDAELCELAPVLRAAHARGVELNIAVYGRFQLGVPTTYDLSLCGASAEERLSGRRLSVLIRDGREAVAAETHPAGTEAIWSESRVFTLLCAEYAKSDIMGRCLIDALGEARYSRLRSEHPRLRTMLRTEPLPAVGGAGTAPKRAGAARKANPRRGG